MFPQKRLVFGLFSLALVACAAPANARDLLGSSIEDAKLLMPEDAAPATSSPDGAILTYHDVKIGQAVWSEITFRFDATHRLASLSLRTRDLSYDALRARAQAQLQAYAGEQMQQQASMGTIAAPAQPPMQIRLCSKGDEVEMTYERSAQEL